MHADHVGIQTEASADIAVDVRVGVDHARQHQPAGDVDHLLGARRQDVLLDGGDLAVADGDVHDAVDAGCRTDDASAAKQQIIFRILRHFAFSLFDVGAVF